MGDGLKSHPSGIKLTTPSLQGKRLIHYTMAAPGQIVLPY